jgi:hypothetical protein
MITDIKTTWRKLAQANDLEFSPGYFLVKGPQIVGEYRGHTLKLGIFGKVYFTDKFLSTRIILSINTSNSTLYNSKGGIPKQAVSNLRSPITSPDFILKGRIYIGINSHHLYYIQNGIENDEPYLQSLFDILSEIGDSFASVIAIGGETVPILQEIASDTNHILKEAAIQLLRGIAQETTDHLAHNALNLICPKCAVCCYPHDIYLSEEYFATYYGCRACGQSREFFEGQIIATLDNQMKTEKSVEDNTLRVNWLHRRDLFDFHRVEIIQATDEDVERFAVQVGNDTDPIREVHYRKMSCTISSKCELSQNTMRILKQMFGQVTKTDLIAKKT